jgi:PKD repeat protein
VYKGVAADLTIQAVFAVEFRVSPLTSSPFARKFTASNIDNRQVEWDFGDGTPVSTEPSPSHTYQFEGQQQTFVVRLTVTDGPCTVVSEQAVVISRPVQNTFSIEPLAFCIRDKGRKAVKIGPEQASLDEIKNINKLRIEQDATSKEIFFVPARQDISQTTEFPLSYKGIEVKLTIFVPNAGFIMNITQNTSPLAQFPVLLNLKAKEQNADSYIWTLSNNFGQSVEIKEREVKDFEMAKLRDPNNSITPLNIVLVVSFSKRTGVACEDKKDYIITADVLGNHRNKGEFDNLARS